MNANKNQIKYWTFLFAGLIELACYCDFCTVKFFCEILVNSSILLGFIKKLFLGASVGASEMSDVAESLFYELCRSLFEGRPLRQFDFIIYEGLAFRC